MNLGQFVKESHSELFSNRVKFIELNKQWLLESKKLSTRLLVHFNGRNGLTKYLKRYFYSAKDIENIIHGSYRFTPLEKLRFLRTKNIR